MAPFRSPATPREARIRSRWAAWARIHRLPSRKAARSTPPRGKLPRSPCPGKPARTSNSTNIALTPRTMPPADASWVLMGANTSVPLFGLNNAMHILLAGARHQPRRCHLCEWRLVVVLHHDRRRTGRVQQVHARQRRHRAAHQPDPHLGSAAPARRATSTAWIPATTAPAAAGQATAPPPARRSAV